MKKWYIIDTNVLLENENAIEILRNGEENKIYIPQVVIDELDSLKKNTRLRTSVARVVSHLLEYPSYINILPYPKSFSEKNDDIIIQTIKEFKTKSTIAPIFVTNDRMLQFKAIKNDIKIEEFKRSNPFSSDSEKYTGFVDYDNQQELIPNCFFWKEGKLHHYTSNKVKPVDYMHENWKVKPKNIYQNAAFELINNEKIDLISIQSSHGQGKTYIALASMLELMLKQKKYDKMYVFKSNYEIGNELGFLPGKIEEKMEPFFRPIKNLLFKLHEQRAANKMFLDSQATKLEFDDKKIEMLPINFVRGENFENCIILVDEIQNLSRSSVRSLLSRMGENVKCICTGDVHQIDNPYLNHENNGMNWIVKLLKGYSNYGHIVLKGENGRGPIADMIRNSRL